MILSCAKENNYLSELISLEMLSRGDWDQSGLFSPILKRKWEGARCLRSQRASIPWRCARGQLPLSGWSSPRREGCPQLRRQEACSISPTFLLALQSCPVAMLCSLQLRAPADSTQPTEPSLVRGPRWGFLLPGGLGTGLRGRVLEAAAESGLLMSGGTSNQFHASGVSCL